MQSMAGYDKAYHESAPRPDPCMSLWHPFILAYIFLYKDRAACARFSLVTFPRFGPIKAEALALAQACAWQWAHLAVR